MFQQYLDQSVASDSMSFHTKDYIFPSQMGGGRPKSVQKQKKSVLPGRPIHQDFVTLDSQVGGEPEPYSTFSSQSESQTVSSIDTSGLHIPRNNWSETSGTEASSYEVALPENLGKMECHSSDSSSVSGFTSGITSSLQTVSDSTKPLTQTSLISESSGSGIVQKGGFFRAGSAAPYAFCDKMMDSQVQANVDSQLSHTAETAQLEHQYRYMPYSFSESETSQTGNSSQQTSDLSSTSALSTTLQES